MNAWIPIEQSVFIAASTLLPCPKEAQRKRSPVICKKLIKNPELNKNFMNCDCSENAPIIIFISKMISVNKKNINEQGLSKILNKIP